LNQKKYIEVTEILYHLLTKSTNVKVNQRGRAIGMMNAGTKPR